MEVQDILLEPAPELLDGVGPGGVGWQGHELDRQVEARGSWTGLRRPGAWAEEREGRGLGLEGGQDVRVEVDRPVVLDQIDPLARIGRDEGLVEADQGWDVDAGALAGDDPAGVGVEGADHAGRGVAPGGPFGARVGAAGRGIARGERGLAIVGHLVEIEQHRRGRGRLDPGADRRQVGQLLLVGRVRAVQMVASTFPAQLAVSQHPPDARQAPTPEFGHTRPQRRERPAGLGQPVLPRVTPEQLQQPGWPLRPLGPAEGGGEGSAFDPAPGRSSAPRSRAPRSGPATRTPYPACAAPTVPTSPPATPPPHRPPSRSLLRAPAGTALRPASPASATARAAPVSAPLAGATSLPPAPGFSSLPSLLPWYFVKLHQSTPTMEASLRDANVRGGTGAAPPSRGPLPGRASVAWRPGAGRRGVQSTARVTPGAEGWT